MHKHFHMLAIAMALRSHGHVTPATPHTRVPGIWAKLDALYDLPSLDLRENSFAFDGLPDPANRDDWDRLPEFRLPGMGGLVPGGGGGSGVRSGAKGGGGKAATTNATTAADDGNNDGDAGQEDNAQAFADLIWARRFPDGSPGEDSDASEGSSPVAEELVSRKGDPPPVPLGEVGEEIMKREGTADTNEDEAGTGTGTGKSTPASSVKGRAAGRARGGRRRR
ncbi:hypothetical protein BDY21DRAFT_54977 [Lineolata rhizophorae]|uniref:Uncharacterized protein n=1 Tax=Lineolata rhizophorae TaxID=578093 RepID=A0A6A6NW96_9PEZI|nr:hypothetical protein BDY21DRAFT_54977 [Lineolata rhizophorae]